MGIILEQAEASIHEMASEIMTKLHDELRLPDGTHPRLCILVASSSDREIPAVNLHGYPCYAKISVIPYKQRVDKRADAEIIIDKDVWLNTLTEPQQRAILDHEITHLEILKNSEGFVITDDIGRPKLGIRLHDWFLGGFRSIAQRYGEHAIEVLEARKFQEKYGDVTLTKPLDQPLFTNA